MKKGYKIFGAVVACIGLLAVWLLFVPTLENRTWVLFTAQKSDMLNLVVAHDINYDASNDTNGFYQHSKPIELICEAKDGKLILTDKTNNKTYEGTYKNASGRFSLFKRFKTYTVTIDGLEGTANISSNKTLFVSLGGYSLNFAVEQ